MVNVDHSIAISLNTSDKELLRYVQNQNKPECSLDDSGSGQTSVVVTYSVVQIRHMVDGPNFESMCIVRPSSRFAEQVTTYLLDPGNCSAKFLAAVRS